MNDRMADWLRTVVPALWSALVTWAVIRNLLPASFAGWANGLGGSIAAPVVLGLVYAGLRWFEARSWVPDWLTRLLLGSARTPTYIPTHAHGAIAEWIRKYDQGSPLMVLPPSAVTTVPVPPTEPAIPPGGPAGMSPPAPPA